MYKHAFLEMSSPEEDEELWMTHREQPAMKTILLLQAQNSCPVTHIPIFGLGLCHTAQKDSCYGTSRTQNAPHALPVSWESTTQTQHLWGRWAAAWCELNSSLAAAEGSDTQTPAVLTLHSTYKCINLSLVISNIQHFTTLGLILNKTCTLFTCI